MALSQYAQNTIDKYGKDLALEALSLHRQGECADSVSWYILPKDLQCKKQVAIDLIHAGRELMLEFLKRNKE